MRKNKGFILFCLGGMVLSSVVLAQSLTDKPLFEADSIKVVANNKFPKDLECEIFVGPKGLPYFRAEGEQNQVKKFTIETVGSGPAISMLRKEGGTNSYILALFTEDTEGRVLMFLDFNSDGVWDVKRTPTQEQKNFIFVGNQWVAVARIDGLLSAKPVAEGQGGRYEFHGGVWKRVPE